MKLLKILNRIYNRWLNQIPYNIDQKEKIVNIVFSPLNFRPNGQLRSNAFKCRKGKDDLSVNRLNYTSLDFCKKQGQELEANAKQKIKGKNFIGIALLFAQEIRQVAKDVISKPVKGNKAHAEIQTGYIVAAGEAGPSEYLFIVDELAEKSRIYKDEDKTSSRWTNPNKEEIHNLKI